MTKPSYQHFDYRPISGALGAEIVREHRVRRWTRARLADADADARDRQLQKAAREPRRRGHATPEEEADRDQLGAVPSVGDLAQRDPEDRVEDREGRSVQEAEVGVGEAEVLLQLLGEDRRDLAIDEVVDVQHHEREQHVLRVRSSDLRRGLARSFRARHNRSGSYPDPTDPGHPEPIEVRQPCP